MSPPRVPLPPPSPAAQELIPEVGESEAEFLQRVRESYTGVDLSGLGRGSVRFLERFGKFAAGGIRTADVESEPNPFDLPQFAEGAYSFLKSFGRAASGGVRSESRAANILIPEEPGDGEIEPRKPIGTRELRNGVMSQVVALDANNNPVWRPVTEPGPLGRRILEQGARAAEGFGPSGGAFLAYLDSLGRMDPVLPGFGGQQRAAEVARFTAALPSNRLDFVDDTGTPRQTRTAFEASVFFTEQAYLGELPFLGNLKGELSADTLKALRTGAMPKIATEQVWDAISARNNWGLTGAEVLEQAGYIDRGGGIWERVDEPQISGYGGGSFGSGGGDGFPAFGFPPSSPFRNPLGMVNWRIV